MNRDLTTGNVCRNVVLFSLPYLLSYFLQTLYGMADLFIIGQFEGVASTTAVSIGSQVMHMITVMIVGLAMGTTVCIGQAVGGGSQDRVSRTVGNTVTLFMVLSVAAAGLLWVWIRPIVSVMSTPKEAVEGTAAYLTICFLGIPFITAYNIISSIFRGMGDSKSPMYFVAVACVANIALDYLFMGAFHLGPAGAALGTTCSQAISVVIALTVIVKKRSIRLGRGDATDEEVMAAARAAQCEEFIQRLPQGYQTNIGENGSALSGGERQRISIARALLKNAPIVLLDEATASMDAESETLIQDALSVLLKDKTVMVIAHRMRTVANADKIVVLDDGKVSEMGTPAELMKKGGLYAHLVELQQGK